MCLLCLFLAGNVTFLIPFELFSNTTNPKIQLRNFLWPKIFACIKGEYSNAEQHLFIREEISLSKLPPQQRHILSHPMSL